MNTIEEAKSAANDAKQEGLLGKYPMAAIILSDELDRIADEERRCCPECVGFHEYIKSLEKAAYQLAAAASAMYPHATSGRAAMRDAISEYKNRVAAMPNEKS